MFLKIPKMIARNEAQPFRKIEGHGAVGVGVPAFWLSVRQVNTEYEQLDCRKPRRHRPLNHEVGKGARDDVHNPYVQIGKQ